MLWICKNRLNFILFSSAIGLIIGAAFTSMVNSFVADIISPLIGLMFQVNLGNNYIILRCPENVTLAGNCSTSAYATPILANEVGIVSWNYGNFLQVAVNFLLTASVLFFIIKAYSAAFRRTKPEPKTKECKYCTKDIPIKATRCPECTSGVDLDMSHESYHME